MNQCSLWQFRFLWLEMCLFCGIVTSFAFNLALFLWFLCDLGAILRVGWWDREVVNYVITCFLRNCIILFSTIDWCQCPLLRSTFPSVTVRRSDFSFLLDIFQVSLDLRESEMWSLIPGRDEDGLINDNLCWNTCFDSFAEIRRRGNVNCVCIFVKVNQINVFKIWRKFSTDN